jgi:hypothetical protein
LQGASFTEPDYTKPFELQNPTVVPCYEPDKSALILISSFNTNSYLATLRPKFCVRFSSAHLFTGPYFLLYGLIAFIIFGED